MIKREHVCLQHSPQGDMAVVHVWAKDPAKVMLGMLAGAAGSTAGSLTQFFAARTVSTPKALHISRPTW